MKRFLAQSIAFSMIVLGASFSASAEGDAVKGKRVYNKCRACHSLDADRNMTGPSLAGIIGKKAATAKKYRYSKAMQNSGWTWDEETLSTFLTSPRKSLKGTKMAFAGLRKPTDIQNLIAFLKEN